MSGILNTLLDINQLEAGIVEAVPTSFSVNGLLERLRAEFADCVERKGLRWRVVPCSKVIHSDQRLLAAILRNLLSNAVKYTTSGKVLLAAGEGDKIYVSRYATAASVSRRGKRMRFSRNSTNSTTPPASAVEALASG
jgi:signal transduction histidine kinase